MRPRSADGPALTPRRVVPRGQNDPERRHNRDRPDLAHRQELLVRAAIRIFKLMQLSMDEVKGMQALLPKEQWKNIKITLASPSW